MAWQELSPHDETILFQLVEIERNLPREQQSRRFKVEVSERPNKAPEALIQPASTRKSYVLKSEAECFGELVNRGYIEVAHIGYAIPDLIRFVHTGPIPVELTPLAFRYYDEKHDFPTSLADERRELVDSRISTVYPEVVAYLKKAYDAIWIEQPEGNWSSVAHDCQDALKAFADKVYQPEYASRLAGRPPSSADFEEKLEQTIRANTGGEELRSLLVKLNKYVNARRHDPGTTRDEAKRCVLLTYLLVAEICELLGLSEAT